MLAASCSRSTARADVSGPPSPARKDATRICFAVENAAGTHTKMPDGGSNEGTPGPARTPRGLVLARGAVALETAEAAGWERDVEAVLDCPGRKIYRSGLLSSYHMHHTTTRRIEPNCAGK